MTLSTKVMVSVSEKVQPAAVAAAEEAAATAAATASTEAAAAAAGRAGRRLAPASLPEAEAHSPPGRSRSAELRLARLVRVKSRCGPACCVIAAARRSELRAHLVASPLARDACDFSGLEKSKPMPQRIARELSKLTGRQVDLDQLARRIAHEAVGKRGLDRRGDGDVGDRPLDRWWT